MILSIVIVGFTTFSTFAHESMQMLPGGHTMGFPALVALGNG